MRTAILFLLAALATATVDAAWYQQTDGNIINPIQSVYRGDQTYTGYNLEPFAYLTGATLSGADLSKADLYQADLSYADLSEASLSWVEMSFVNLVGANLSGANLTHLDLTHPTMTLYTPDARLVMEFSTFAEQGKEGNTNLTGVDLTEASLSGAILGWVDLTDANLTAATLGNAWLTGADLSGANLTGADLDQANVSGAIFTDVQYWTTTNWFGAYYYTDNVPVWASGMDPVALGILALAPIPEPTTLLLALLALAALPLRVRHG